MRLAEPTLRLGRPAGMVGELELRPAPSVPSAEQTATRMLTDLSPAAASFFAEMTPVERTSLVAGLANFMADDAVEKVDALLGLMNGVRDSVRARHGMETAEPMRFDHGKLRELLGNVMEEGLARGFVAALESVLVTAFGPDSRLSHDARLDLRGSHQGDPIRR